MDPNETHSVSFCLTEVRLDSLTPTNSIQGGWLQYTIPMSTFGCPDLNALNKIDLTALGRTSFCLAEFFLS